MAKTNPPYLTKTITISGADGNHVSGSETADRMEVVVAVQQGTETSAVHLSCEQFEALCATRYSLELTPEKEAVDVP